MKKVGIITYSRSNNYGARIQACAMYKIFQSRGYHVEIIDVDYPKRYIKYILGRVLNTDSNSFVEWVNKYVITFRMGLYTKKNIIKTRHKVTKSTKRMIDYINGKKYDAVICGSDEIWSSRTKELSPPSIYFLPAEICAKRIAFSPSSNGNHIFSEKEGQWLKETFQDYSFLGVRDEYTADMVGKFYDGKINLMFDPTFLIDYKAVELPKILSKKTNKKKVLFCFTRPDKSFPNRVMAHMGFEDYEYYSVYSRVKSTKFFASSPEQFMCIAGKVDIVFTNFFHATIFSVKNSTPVIGVDTFDKYKGRRSKVKDLLFRLNLSDCFYSCIEEDERSFDLMIEYVKSLIALNKKLDYQQRLTEIRSCMERYVDEIGDIINA